MLEWLHDQHDQSACDSELPGIDDYLAEMSLSSDDGDALVDYLVVDRGLVEDFSTGGGTHARITASGMACVQQHRAKRDAPAQRIGTLRSRMLSRPPDGSEGLYLDDLFVDVRALEPVSG